MRKPVVLCILDGWGLSQTSEDSAPHQAHTPTMDRLFAKCPHATLVTHGPDVGLPKGQMGNSEVGHMNIGAGRVVAMDLGQIDLAIETGEFFQNNALLRFISDVKSAGGTAHVIGLTSDGGVHAHTSHILAAVKALSDHGLSVNIHVITDGRDVAQTSAFDQVARFQTALPQNTQIVTVSGRYYAMDRDHRWDRTEKAYRTMIEGKADACDDVLETISARYSRDETDEFIRPFVIEGYTGVQSGDGIFFVNFRADRARQLLSAIGDPNFTAFARNRVPLSGLLGMVDYSDTHNTFMASAFPKRRVKNTLAAWIAQHELRQFHLAETEKYPHVTFFLNGGKEAPEQGEDRHMPASPKVATYDLAPEMNAHEVTEHFVKAIHAGYDFIVVNYANPDMVGHTGNMQAAIKACEAVDWGLGQALEALEAVGGSMIVCADHGNCETMIDPQTKAPHTAHTLNPVPVVLVGGPKGAKLIDGRLADIAPSVLQLMELSQPQEMTGRSLILW